jgi:hypothetical protein
MHSSPFILILAIVGATVLIGASITLGRKAKKKSLVLPSAKASAIIALVCALIGWFYPHTPYHYNQQVQAMVIEKLVSREVHHGRSSYIDYRPHLTVQYAVNGQKYASDCWIGPPGFFDQLAGGDYSGTAEGANKVLEPYQVGSTITVYYAASDPGCSSVNAELHVGNRMLLFFAMFFLCLAALALLFPSLAKDPKLLGNENEIATSGKVWQNPVAGEGTECV